MLFTSLYYDHANHYAASSYSATLFYPLVVLRFAQFNIGKLNVTCKGLNMVHEVYRKMSITLSFSAISCLLYHQPFVLSIHSLASSALLFRGAFNHHFASEHYSHSFQNVHFQHFEHSSVPSFHLHCRLCPSRQHTSTIWK